MVWPAVIAAVATIGSGIMQWMNSEEARKASEAERQQMLDMLNQIQQPDFDMRGIEAPQYKLLQKYVPEAAQYVEEQAPQLIKADTEGAKAGRAAQMEALQKMRNLSDSGQDAISAADTQAALDQASAQSQGQRQAILQNMGARGTLTGGMALANQLQAQQEANKLAQTGALQANADAQRRRLEAIRQSGAFGSQIRGEDVDVETRNATTMNDFNRRVAANRNEFNQKGTDIRNQAQMYNIGQGQHYADKNVDAGYQHKLNERNNYNDLQGRKFTAAINKQGLRSDIGGMARADAMTGAAQKNQAISGMAQGVGKVAKYYEDKEDDEAEE